jgi:predicted dithiol-disulfide oxidoreductase (DUF899 family)
VPWYSSDGGDFNFDFHVSFETDRGPDHRAGPPGGPGGAEDRADGPFMSWMRRHDEY